MAEPKILESRQGEAGGEKKKGGGVCVLGSTSTATESHLSVAIKEKRRTGTLKKKQNIYIPGGKNGTTPSISFPEGKSVKRKRKTL